MIQLSALTEYSPYWETDEFEDKVARGLIAMYESKLKVRKRSVPACRLSEDLLMRVKRLGCYFPSNDRIIMEEVSPIDGRSAKIQSIDPINDGRPDFAILTTTQGNKDSELSYLQTTYLEKINSLPKPFKSDVKGRIYRIAFLDFTNNAIEGMVDYVVIDSKGSLYPVHRYVRTTDRTTGRDLHIKDIPNGSGETCEDNVTIWATAAIQFYQDRRFLWNVLAKEGIAKATFAVHEEQIKSLFYSRELPMTETGRKRPILHWVNAHQRRMKSGIDFDVEKHLRGSNEFVYNGTKFEIINPLKKAAA